MVCENVCVTVHSSSRSLLGIWCISTFKVDKLELRGECQCNTGFRKTGGFCRG